MRSRVLLVALLALAFAGCGGDTDGGLNVSDVRVAEPTGPNAALYFTVTADTEDTLIGAETGVASVVHIHETVVGDDGTMGMQPVDSLDVLPGETLVLEPGGLHLMLIDAERLGVGDEVEITLIWASAGEQTVSAEVVEPGGAMSDMDDG